MRCLLIPVAFTLCFTAATAAEKPYVCHHFVADFVKASDTSSGQKFEPSSGFLRSAAMVLGVYMGATKQALDPNDSGMEAFERQVIGACSAKPKSPVEEIALKESFSLKQKDERQDEQVGNYKKMSLTDLKLDKSSIIGKNIEVSGVLQTVGDISMVSDGLLDMNKILVETKNLPRESRKFIIDNCSAGCKVSLKGVVASIMLQDGIVAHQIRSN